MITWYKFKKSMPPGNRMDQYKTIYAINSLVADVCYGMSGGMFAIIDSDKGVLADLDDVPELADQVAYLPFKKELLAVYEDIKEIGLERRW